MLRKVGPGRDTVCPERKSRKIILEDLFVQEGRSEKIFQYDTVGPDRFVREDLSTFRLWLPHF